MDTFFEQIVQKKKGAKEWAIIVAVLLGGLILLAAVFLFIPSLLIFVLMGVGYGGWWLISGQNS